MSAVPSDLELVTELLGRRPMGDFEVVIRRADGTPVVLANEPLLASGRPMPTRFWLCDRALNKVIGTLESEGGVNRAEAEIPEADIAATHERARAERDARLPAIHEGPLPSGGVGGTRVGVKCLHAHYANLLAGQDDVVGAWVQRELDLIGRAFDPSQPGLASTWSSDTGSADG